MCRYIADNDSLDTATLAVRVQVLHSALFADIHLGRTRCFAFWQEFSKVIEIGLTEADYQCYAGADSPKDCLNQKEDYLECLHHTKEVRGQRWSC